MPNQQLPSSLGPALLRSAEELVTSALRDAILAGELRPGTWLRQEAVAARLGVSRIPLRDALRRLATEGLVYIDPRRGAYVASLTVEDVEEIYSLRLLLEPPCIAAAVRRLDETSLKRLDSLIDAMDNAPTPAAGFIARRRFYADLYELSGMSRTAELILRLRDDVHRYHVMAQTTESRHAHQQLREKLHERDARGAAKLIKSHLAAAASDLITVLKREESESLRIAIMADQ